MVEKNVGVLVLGSALGGLLGLWIWGAIGGILGSLVGLVVVFGLMSMRQQA